MKLVNTLLVACLVVISAVIIYLLVGGTALRSAGVIKPTVLDSENKLLPKSVALRLFPEFQSSPNTVWLATAEMQPKLASVVASIHNYYKTLKAPNSPELVLINSSTQAAEVATSQISKWWVFESENELVLKNIRQNKIKLNVIYVNEFNRNEVVPANCETEKMLSRECLKVVAIREVKKKFKTEQRYFFMRRYKDHEFYLFIEE
jgi:hypothetical protein